LSYASSIEIKDVARKADKNILSQIENARGILKSLYLDEVEDLPFEKGELEVPLFQRGIPEQIQNDRLGVSTQ